jgi:hypothetical protein
VARIRISRPSAVATNRLTTRRAGAATTFGCVEVMKLGNLLLGLAHGGRGRQRLRYGFAMHLVGEAQVGAVAGIWPHNQTVAICCHFHVARLYWLVLDNRFPTGFSKMPQQPIFSSFGD